MPYRETNYANSQKATGVVTIDGKGFATHEIVSTPSREIYLIRNRYRYHGSAMSYRATNCTVFAAVIRIVTYKETLCQA